MRALLFIKYEAATGLMSTFEIDHSFFFARVARGHDTLSLSLFFVPNRASTEQFYNEHVLKDFKK